MFRLLLVLLLTASGTASSAQAPNPFGDPVRTSTNHLTVEASISRLSAAPGDRLTVTLDIFNFANFINRDWGKVRQVGFGGVIPALNYDSKEAGSMVGAAGARPIFTWNPSYRFSNDQNVASNYRMQFSIRYSF